MINFTALISIRRPWQILKPTQKLGCEFCDFCGILVEFFLGFEYNFWKKIIWDLRTLVYLSDRAVLLVMVFTVTIHKYLILTRVKINKTKYNPKMFIYFMRVNIIDVCAFLRIIILTIDCQTLLYICIICLTWYANVYHIRFLYESQNKQNESQSKKWLFISRG